MGYIDSIAPGETPRAAWSSYVKQPGTRPAKSAGVGFGIIEREADQRPYTDDQGIFVGIEQR